MALTARLWNPQQFDVVTGHMDDRARSQVFVARTNGTGTAASSTSETMLSEFPIPSTLFQAGTVIEVIAAGLFAEGAAETVVLTIRFGGTAGQANSGNICLRNSTGYNVGSGAQGWGLFLNLLMNGAGTSATFNGFGVGYFGQIEAAPTMFFDIAGLNVLSVNTTASVPMKVTATWTGGLTSSCTLYSNVIRVTQPNQAGGITRI